MRLSMCGSGILGQSLRSLRQQLPDWRLVQRRPLRLSKRSRALPVRLCRRHIGWQQLRCLRPGLRAERGLPGGRVLSRLRYVDSVRSVVRRHRVESVSLRELRVRLSARRILRCRQVSMSRRNFGLQRRLHQHDLGSLELRHLRNRVRRRPEL
jgi:hypothetical protein